MFGVAGLLALAACLSPTERELKDSEVSVTMLTGETVDLPSLLAEDKTTLLVFMTSWCSVCKREQPVVERFARERGGDVQVYNVISGANLEDARALFRDRAMEVELLVDEFGDLAMHLGVKGTPTLAQFDRSGQRVGTYYRIEDVPGQSTASPAGLVEVVDDGRELGTSYDVVVLAVDRLKARADLARARELCREMERRFSGWREDSEVSRLNREAGLGAVPVSPQMGQLITGALHISEVTGGAFDLTWRSLEGGEDRRSSARADVGWQHVILENDTVRFARPGTRIGIDGVAKGWIIDAVFYYLRDAGYDDIIVNIGGDLRTAGRDASGNRRVFHVTDPTDLGRVACRIDVEDLAVATSGNYIRTREVQGELRGHIVDPRTGRTPEFDGSVTVLTQDAAMADALATALFVLGPEEGLAFARRTPGVDVVYATSGGVQSTLGSTLRIER